MGLQRRVPRQTITLGDFSFAEGEITLVHPVDAPHFIMRNMEMHGEVDLEEYFLFSISEGVLDPEDFSLLADLSTSEVVEVATQLFGAPECTCGTDDSPINAETGLTEAEEALIADLAESLTPYTLTEEPGGDGEEGDGLASI